MIGSSIHKLLLGVLAVLMGMGICYAQQPTITPKPGPLVFYLDKNGNLGITFDSVATVTPDSINANPRTTVNPTYFNCATRGAQTVVVTATDEPPPITFNNPVGVCFDPAGNLYITDPGNHQIRKIAVNGDVTIFAGSVGGNTDGDLTKATFDTPEGIVMDAAGNLYITDSKEFVVREISAAGQVTTPWGTPNISTATNQAGIGYSFGAPYGIAINKNGNIFVADAGSNRIVELGPGGVITAFAGNTAAGDVNGTGTGAEFNLPTGLAFDAAGNMLVTDSYNNKIKKITPAGVVTTYAGSGTAGFGQGPVPAATATFTSPEDLAIDANGNVFVSDTKNNQIREINTAGIVSTFAGRVPYLDGTTLPGDVDGPGLMAQFNTPEGLCFDSSGNLYVADALNNQIRKIIPADTVSTLAGSGAAGDQNGNIYIPTNQPPVTDTIPIMVETSLKITTKYSDVNLLPCQTTLPDFAKTNPPEDTEDNCNDNFVVQQIPAAGTPVTSNEIIPISIVIEDATGRYDTASFKAYAAQLDAVPTVTVQPSTTSPVCRGTTISFAASTSHAITPTFQWLVNGVASTVTDSTFSGIFNNGDVITCHITSQNACLTPAGSNPYTVQISPAPIINFNSNITLKNGSGVQLNPVITGNIQSYLWSPTYALSDSISANPIASPTKTTTYTLTATSTAGCDTSARITVTVVDDVIVPNAFTPNGDGINDFWDLKGIILFPNCTVSIFNRYGSRLFYSKGYSKPWYGTYNGSPVPVGTYYYIIDLKDGSPLLSGPVTVVR